MKNGTSLRIGAIGTAVTALCCFTPILVWLLGVLGLGLAGYWLDVVLIPMLLLFAATTLYGLWRRTQP